MSYLVVHVLQILCILMTVAAAAKSLQSRPTLSDPIDGSPPGSSVHGIFQAGVLEWGAIAFSNDSRVDHKMCVCVCVCVCV